MAANVELHISWVLERWVIHLPPPNMPASNCQREEVLAVLLLVADLDPRPLSNIGDLVASYNSPCKDLVVFTAEIPDAQNDLWRRDSGKNICIAPNANIKYVIILSGVLHLEMFCAFDVVQDFPLRPQLWNCHQLVAHI